MNRPMYWALSAIILSALLTSSCNSKKGTMTGADSTLENFKEEKWTPIAPDTAAMRKKYTCVEIITTEGKLELALFDATPGHRDNFIKLVKSGFYKDLLFHRVINNFMIQGGDAASKNVTAGKLGNVGKGETQPGEFVDTLYHYRGALAAARVANQMNPQRESSISQFYIVTGEKQSTKALRDALKERAILSFVQDPDNMSYGLRMEKYRENQDMAAMNVLMAELETAVKPLMDSLYNSIPAHTRQMYATWGGFPKLDKEYTIFGFLISGYDVLDRIQKIPTDHQEKPLTDVRIISARVLEKE